MNSSCRPLVRQRMLWRFILWSSPKPLTSCPAVYFLTEIVRETEIGPYEFFLQVTCKTKNVVGLHVAVAEEPHVVKVAETISETSKRAKQSWPVHLAFPCAVAAFSQKIVKIFSRNG